MGFMFQKVNQMMLCFVDHVILVVVPVLKVICACLVMKQILGTSMRYLNVLVWKEVLRLGNLNVEDVLFHAMNVLTDSAYLARRTI
jgi:hypothetical protein